MLNEGQSVKPNGGVADSKDAASDEFDLMTEKIRSGEALLRVVEYPWGVEFGVCESSVTSRHVD